MRISVAAILLALTVLVAPAFGQSEDSGAGGTGDQAEQRQTGGSEQGSQATSQQDTEQSGEQQGSSSTPQDSGTVGGESGGGAGLTSTDTETLGNKVIEIVSGDDGSGGDKSGEGTQADKSAPAEETKGEEILTALETGDWDKLFGLIGPYFLSLLLDVLTVIGIIVAALVIGAWARRVLRHGLIKIRVEQTVAQFLGNIARWAILVLALVMCLDRFGVNITSLAALIGAAALTIGLAFQGALSNIAAGVMLLIFRPFKVDEWVELDGELGIVEDIDLFYTHINQFDNRHIVLPNSKVLEGKIESLTHNPYRRVHLPVGVAYDTDLVKCEEALHKAARDPEEAIKDRDPMIILTEFGDSSINWEVRVWCQSDRYMILRHQMVHAIAARFREADITIPFPQRDLNTNRPLRVTLEESVDKDAESRGESAGSIREAQSSSGKLERSGDTDEGEGGDGGR